LSTERPLRIVLVDDDARMVALLESILTDDGFEVHGFQSPDEAIARLEALAPDVVVLDVVMPGRDGLEVGQDIRELHPHQAVVLFSSLFDLSLSGEAARLGFRYVEKADGIEALERVLTEAASAQR